MENNDTSYLQSSLHVLLVEDNPGDIRLLQEIMRETPVNLTLEYVGSLADSFPLLEEKFFDVILLDLSLPDSSGLATVSRMREKAPDYPIVVLTGLNDEATALNAVREGAQDYLIKGQIDGSLLLRAIRYSIERNRMRATMRSLSLIDDLTGIYNRSGFMTLARHQVQFSQRKSIGFHLLFLDLDGLQNINDKSYELGDQMLIAVARLLSNTFRGSDVVARVGGDEFTVITAETEGHNSENILERLKVAIGRHNQHSPDMPPISVSYGIVFFEAAAKVSLEHLLEEARQICQNNKQQKKKETENQAQT
ncbi:MAG: diguanylate cyclase [Zoogloeaceae bacterium]|jgi:diguanylate cyclase (GGDEF)-like protein|nr:diguanylate cyclase [Zoogloeaceae bacterium]